MTIMAGPESTTQAPEPGGTWAAIGRAVDRFWAKPIDFVEVVGLIEKGAFVEFGEERFEGLLPVRRLRGWWSLNELGTALEAEGSGRRLRLGDRIQVEVDRVDAPRGRVDLSAYSLRDG